MKSLNVNKMKDYTVTAIAFVPSYMDFDQVFRTVKAENEEEAIKKGRKLIKNRTSDVSIEDEIK